MHPTVRPAALLLPAILALAGCGGGGEREALRAYEAALEKSIEEDGRIEARLKDLREDLLAGTATAEEMDAYAKTEASPFYARLRELASKTPAGAERLAKVHAVLLDYVDQRTAYLAALGAFLAGDRGEPMRRLHAARKAGDDAYQELAKRTGGNVADAGLQDAMNVASLFMQAKYTPFQAGKVPVDEVEAALRGELLPRLQKVAERSKANLAAEGAPGAIARWAAAELGFFQELAASLPVQATLQKNALASQKAWDAGGEARAKYLADLRAYRDSLR